MPVEGIVAHFAPRGSVPGENSFIEPKGINGHQRPVPVPPAAVRHGKARQSSGTGPCGDCRRSYGYRARGVSIPAKFVLSRNVAKNGTGTLVAYPEVEVKVRDLVRVVGIVAPFAPRRGRYPGKIRYIEPQMVKGHRRTVVCALAAVSHGRAKHSLGSTPLVVYPG